MAVERSESRELAARLVADASLVDGLLAAVGPPDAAEAAELAEAVAVLTPRLRALSVAVGRAHAGQLPTSVRDGYRDAVQRLGEAEAGLQPVAGALRRIRPARPSTPASDDVDEF